VSRAIAINKWSGDAHHRGSCTRSLQQQLLLLLPPPPPPPACFLA
jgi:hypothetical protein